MTVWQPLFERLLAEMDHRSSADWQAPQLALDPAIYQAPERFQAERERLFGRLPLCLGHADQLDPGSVLAFEPCGVPVLLVRDRSGVLRCFLNVCRHRGARLVTQEGEVCRKQALVCPYHAWTYRLDGSLAGLPRPEAFPELERHLLGLRELPSTVRHGLVWAMLDPGLELPDMAMFLGELDRELDAIGMADFHFYRQHAVKRATNWKLIVDAFLEVYHVTRLHAGTIAPFFPDDAVAVNDSLGSHVRSLIAREGTSEIRSLPPERWSPQRHGTLVHLIFPNTIFIYHPDYISHLGLFPSTADQTLFVHSMLIPEKPRDEKAEAHWRRSFELIDNEVFNKEDLVICEQIQRGLKCGANDTLIVGRLEQNLRRFHASVDTALI